MDEEEVRDLIRRAVKGDREAADELARRYEGPMRMRLHRRLGDDIRARADTEDLFQSTIMAALKDLPKLEYKGERAFVGWLSTIAARQVIEKARHARAAKRDVKRQKVMDAAGFAASFTSPSQGAARQELSAGLREALAQLPDAERRVVELHSYQGLSFDAAAKEMGLSGKVAAYRLFERALKKMGAIMDGDADEEEGSRES